MSHLDRVTELTELRRGLIADLEATTANLRREVVSAIEAGELSELGAHKLTGVSRSTVREWLGKPAGRT